MTLNNVVLPDPFGPIRPRISLSLTARLTSRTAATPPNDLETRSSSRRIRRPLAIAPGWCWVRHTAGRDVLWPDKNLLPTLPLVGEHDDLAGPIRVELDR